MTGTGLSEV